MSESDKQQGQGNNDNKQENKGNKKVEVSVDGKDKEILPGSYLVSDFKQKVGVDAAKVLEQLIGGKFEPLADSATIIINDGEVFTSHVPRGGSSWK